MCLSFIYPPFILHFGSYQIFQKKKFVNALHARFTTHLLEISLKITTEDFAFVHHSKVLVVINLHMLFSLTGSYTFWKKKHYFISNVFFI